MILLVVILTEYLVLEFLNMNNNFCYIYGGITFSIQKRDLTPLVNTACHQYFGLYEDKSWVLKIC